MLYLWLKLLHIFLIVSWFAGLFYLPRVYVNLAALSADSAEYRQLLAMSRRLCRFMTPIGVLALLSGVGVASAMNAWVGQGWAHGKLLLGVVLALYHYQCLRCLRAFERHDNRRSHIWFRWFNEAPVFLLLAAIYLALFKPF